MCCTLAVLFLKHTLAIIKLFFVHSPGHTPHGLTQMSQTSQRIQMSRMSLSYTRNHAAHSLKEPRSPAADFSAATVPHKLGRPGHQSQLSSAISVASQTRNSLSFVSTFSQNATTHSGGNCLFNADIGTHLQNSYLPPSTLITV